MRNRSYNCFHQIISTEIYVDSILPCVSRILAFIVKKLIRYFFACFIGKLDSSRVATTLEKIYDRHKKAAWAYAWAGAQGRHEYGNVHASASACVLMRATILDTLFIKEILTFIGLHLLLIP